MKENGAKENRGVARATQIRIATGTTSYDWDPKEGERVSSREVRVEVTYRLAPGEDAALVAFAKAEEVERTRLTVWERIRAGTGDAAFSQDRSLSFDDPGPAPPDEEEPCYPDPFPEEAHYAGNRNDHDNGYIRPNGIPVGLPARPAASVPYEATEWATRPQEMAIQSHFKRLCLGPGEQAALLKERFNKTTRLTKAEAAQLMRALESGEWTASAIATVH